MSAGAKTFTGLVVLLAVAVGVYCYGNAGYGKVSPRAYEYAHALYAACLAKSESRVARVVERLEQEEVSAGDELALADQERHWLQAIIALADDERWKAAAKKARWIMEDQIDR